MSAIEPRRAHWLRGPVNPWILLLLVVWIPVFSTAAVAGDAEVKEAVKRYKKFIKDKSPEARVAVVKSLEGHDSGEVVKALSKSLGDKSWRVRQAVLEVLSGFRSDDAVAEMTKLAGRGKPLGKALVLRALARSTGANALDLFLAQASDRAWEVRHAVAECLGQFRDDVRVNESLALLLQDPETPVKTEAANSVGKVGAVEAVPMLIELLKDESWQPRSAAAEALGKIRDARAIQPLIELMREPGRLQLDAKEALKAIALLDYGTSADGWQKWWNRNREGYVVPEDKTKDQKEVAARSAGPAKPAVPSAGSTKSRYGTTTRYYGVATPSERIIFVLDVSRSMEYQVDVVRPELLAARDIKSDVKLEIAKGELVKTLDELDPRVQFNIIVFHTEVEKWKKGLQACNPANRKSAIAYVKKQKARGAARAKPQPGRKASAPTEEGRTNTYGALAAAFSVAGIGTMDRYYKTGVDTIFFLSDGEPTAGDLTRTQDILSEIARLNKLRRVTLNTINLSKGQAGAGLLRGLAVQSGGTYVDLVGVNLGVGRNRRRR